MRWTWMAVAACLGCTSEPVDVVIISVDTLRVDHVSAYDPASPARTPHMDSLAADGVLHTQAFSPVSVTAPAFASLMTGQHPGQHGVLMNLFRGGNALPEAAETLAERFAAADANYATGAFVGAYTLRREVGLGQGFQVYNGGERANRWGAQTFSVALSWLESHRNRPIFLWVHSYDPHGPVRRFAKPADLSQPWENDPGNLVHLPLYQRDAEITDPQFYRQMYARGVEYADEQVGRVLAALKAQERYEDALVILLADHGESLTERELWFDHGTSAHVEQLHIPLVIKYPGGKRAGTRDDRLLSLVDVAPTILSVADLPPLPAPAGRALTTKGPLHTELTGESSHCKGVEALPCTPTGGLGKELAVRSLRTSVLHKTRSSGAVREVYDRAADPRELSPQLATEGTTLGAQLSTFAADRLSRTYVDPPSAGSPETEQTQKLRTLGYIE
jgi:arylsulfatase